MELIYCSKEKFTTTQMESQWPPELKKNWHTLVKSQTQQISRYCSACTERNNQILIVEYPKTSNFFKKGRERKKEGGMVGPIGKKH